MAPNSELNEYRIEPGWIRTQIGLTQRISERLWFKAQEISFADPAIWRRRHPFIAPSDNVVVRFLIPLISPYKANNWLNVCKNLESTVNALRRQTCPNWTVTICCQQAPVGIDFDNQVTFVQYKPHTPRHLIDKKEKLRLLIRRTAQTTRSDGYIFCLDGDDIPHPNLVEYITNNNNGHGYYLPKGYLIDTDKKIAIGYAKSFHTINGSTSALRFDLRKGRHHVIPAILRGPHKKTPERVKAFGLEVEPIPFPAMLYMFNNGDNLELHRGRGAKQLRALKNFHKHEDSFTKIMREFGIVVNY